MNVAILSSSNENVDNNYLSIARSVSAYLAQNDFNLVFGGCSTSMMGICYDEFIRHNKEVYSFTTPKYADDIKNLLKAKHFIRETTFDLKKAIYENSDLIVALAGGIGTLSEIFSFVEENRSGEKEVPIVIYDENHFYDLLIEELSSMEEKGFINNDIKKYITIAHNKEEWDCFMDKFYGNMMLRKGER